MLAGKRKTALRGGIEQRQSTASSIFHSLPVGRNRRLAQPALIRAATASEQSPYSPPTRSVMYWSRPQSASAVTMSATPSTKWLSWP